jgi:hypothetical protein
MTIKELIIKLIEVENLDAEVGLFVNNSHGGALEKVEDHGDSITLSN